MSTGAPGGIPPGTGLGEGGDSGGTVGGAPGSGGSGLGSIGEPGTSGCSGDFGVVLIRNPLHWEQIADHLYEMHAEPIGHRDFLKVGLELPRLAARCR